MIYDHNDVRYKRKRALLGDDIYNGAYYYSVELVENIIPLIKTDRSWITVNYGVGADHSIFIVHDNVTFLKSCRWMQKYDDVIYVVSRQDMVETAEKYFGKTILLPMSIDTQYVKTFRCNKDKDVAFCGRRWWRKDADFREDVDIIENLPRHAFLQEMARYKKVYAVGRCALEAKVLGCEILPYHQRFSDSESMVVYDNMDVVDMLQHKLDEMEGEVDGKKR